MASVRGGVTYFSVMGVNWDRRLGRTVAYLANIALFYSSSGLFVFSVRFSRLPIFYP